jgi:2-polyprenyl-3-methyl-5-hydroxy-6-metoxy-1,4-benzoquinol methylase
LELCRGRVLDVGAGTGVHTLYLQDRGFDVCAIDVLPDAVEIMRRRGTRDARLADIRDFEADPFDTILMMMNGTGILATLEGLDSFLRDVPRTTVRPGSSSSTMEREAPRSVSCTSIRQRWRRTRPLPASTARSSSGTSWAVSWRA